jgi:radical SAM-linked protein
VEGDLRFLSHHETMGTLERCAVRAKLPLRYSQGFNPHPVMSLVLPRPVGVAGTDELLALALDYPDSPASADSDEARGDRLIAELQRQVPAGMTLLRARRVTSRSVRAKRIDCRLPMEPADLPALAARLAELQTLEQWLAERLTSPKRHRPGEPMKKIQIDVKPLTSNLRIEGSDLCWSALPRGESWARPGEVLRLLGLEERINLARVVRTAVEYEFGPAPAPACADDGGPAEPAVGDEGT